MKKVAVIGATGLVGSTILSLLEKIDGIDVQAFASPRSAGKEIPFRGGSLRVEAASPENIDTDYALLSAGSTFSKQIVPALAEKGIVSIDNSSAYRKDPAYPLVVPSVNAQVVKADTKIIANPNCSTIQTVKVLALFKENLTWVNYVSFQSMSGKGQTGIDQLKSESFETADPQIFNQVIPQIGNLVAVTGHADKNRFEEEEKMIFETNKILETKVPVDASCYRVPALFCHGVYTHFGIDKNLSLEELHGTIHGEDLVLHEEGKVISNKDVVGTDNVHVLKLRPMLAPVNSYSYYCLADNLRVGAATNAVDILKVCLKNHS